MPGWFDFAIFLMIVAAVVVVVTMFFVPPRLTSYSSRQNNAAGFPAKFAGFIAAGVIVALAVISTIIASVDVVDTRHVGVKTHFGRPVGTCGAGPCWHSPMDKVSELTEATQLQAFESIDYDHAAKGDANQGASGPAVRVSLANGSIAYVNFNQSWRLREGATPDLFQNFGGSSVDVFKAIKEQLVDRQAQVALVNVFTPYNPQQTEKDPNGGPDQMRMVKPDLAKFAPKVKTELQAAITAQSPHHGSTPTEPDIEILDVRLSAIFFDSGTQGRIDGFNQKVQETRNAEQDVQTAIANREASKQRADQPVPDLKVAQFNCIQEAVTQHRPADAAGCFGQIGGNPLIQIPGR